MQDWKLSSKIIILYYRMYSCGKFLSNVLSFNSKVFPQIPSDRITMLGDLDLLFDIESEQCLTDFKKQEIFNTLPTTKEECMQWSKFELGDLQFWNFFDDDFLDQPDLKFLDQVCPEAISILSNNYYCFITCHDPIKYNALTKVFSNAQTVSLINDHLINNLSIKLKTNRTWYPKEIPLPVSGIQFDIGSIFNQEEFFKNVLSLLTKLGIDNPMLDASVYNYYNQYMELYK